MFEDRIDSQVLDKIVFDILIGKIDVNMQENGKSILEMFLNTRFIYRDNREAILFIRKLFMLGYNGIIPENPDYPEDISQELYCMIGSNLKILQNVVSFGKGSYGTIYSVLDPVEKKPFILKYSVSDEIEDSFYKELIISNYINSLSDDVSIKILDFYKFKTSYALRMEHGLFNLGEFLSLCNSSTIVINIFKDIIKKLKILNDIGIVHLDLKPANIVVMPDLTIRFIDYGLSVFLGFSNNRIVQFAQSFQYKPPDDKNDISSFKYTRNNEEFFDEGTNVPNYTSDLFSVVLILFGYVTKKSHKQVLITNSYVFIFDKRQNDGITSINSKLRCLTKTEMNLISDFSPHLLDFLTDCLCHDATIRLDCEGALNHPFFNDNIIEVPCDSMSISYSPMLNLSIYQIRYCDRFYFYNSNIKILAYRYNNIANKIKEYTSVDDMVTYCNILYLLGGMTNDDNDFKRLTNRDDCSNFFDLFYQSWSTIDKPKTIIPFFNQFIIQNKKPLFLRDLIDCYSFKMLKTNAFSLDKIDKFLKQINTILINKFQNIAKDIFVFDLFDEIINNI